ncbi:MAG: pabB [Myxococcaceae bacterium]|nr:pabB [Myxococcaceae bacterium]
MKHGANVHLLEPLELALSPDRYRDAFPTGCGGFVLDGGEYALLGAEPFLSFRALRSDARTGALAARVIIEERGATMRVEVDDALETLRTLLRENAVDPAVFQGRPLPFLAGAVGYIGYETGQMLERLPCRPRPGLGMPDIALFFHDWVLGACRRTNRTFLSVIGRGHSTTSARSEAERTRDRILSVLASFEQRTRFMSDRPRARPPVPNGVPVSALLASTHASPVVSREDYLGKIAVAKDHITAGDAFEICLTHRIDAPFSGDAFALWQELRSTSPSPFAAFVDLPEGAIVSSSPERFLSIDAARIVESRPIKGTRPRGATPAEDADLASDLATSIKDRAENAMIVDLVRNDLGRVCRFGTVEAPELYAVERYATVHQLVSTVRGELDEGRDAIDAIRACFPPGSMSGAPKIEAMSILEALEPTERGVYSGALGWLDFGGPIDLSVVIRTIVVKDGRAHVHVGGAIVADSDAASEHDETMHKARAMLAALATFAEPVADGADADEAQALRDERAVESSP